MQTVGQCDPKSRKCPATKEKSTGNLINRISSSITNMGLCFESGVAATGSCVTRVSQLKVFWEIWVIFKRSSWLVGAGHEKWVLEK